MNTICHLLAAEGQKFSIFGQKTTPPPRLGQAGQNRAFRLFQKTGPRSESKIELVSRGTHEVPFVDTRRKRAGGAPPAAQKCSSTYRERTCKVALSNSESIPPHSAPPEPHKTARDGRATAPVPPHVESPRLSTRIST